MMKNLTKPIIILVVIVCLLGWVRSCINDSNSKKLIKIINAQYKAEKETHIIDVTKLNSEYTSLEKDYTSLEKEKTALENSQKLVKKELNNYKLDNREKMLEATHSELVDEYSAYRKTVEEMVKNFDKEIILKNKEIAVLKKQRGINKAGWDAEIALRIKAETRGDDIAEIVSKNIFKWLLDKLHIYVGYGVSQNGDFGFQIGVGIEIY